jgi:hypothetical protein
MIEYNVASTRNADKINGNKKTERRLSRFCEKLRVKFPGFTRLIGRTSRPRIKDKK